MQSTNAELTGSVQIGDLEATVSGEFQEAGADTHTVIDIAFPGTEPQHLENVSVGGTTYTFTEAGYWLQPSADVPATGEGQAWSNPLTEALANPASLEVVGSEDADGQRLVRLETTEPIEVGPALFGYADPSVTDGDGSVTFLATEEGDPAGIVLYATWRQDMNGEPVDASMELRFMFVPGSVTIEAPADPWTTYESTDFRYRMAMPVAWDVGREPATDESDAYDLYYAPVDGEVQVFWYPDTEGALANEWFRESSDLIAQYLAPPEHSTPMTLPNGLEAMLFMGHYAEGTDTVFYQQAVVFGGDVAWDVDWYSIAGNEAADFESFTTFLESFEPLAAGS